MPSRGLLLAGVSLAVVLTVTVIPGPFTIDESNYLVTVLALRAGGLVVPGTAGLPPSRELLWFDPAAARREVAATPVSSTAPPLYAPLALPFSFLGWRGLVALNTLAFLATILIVFDHARRHRAAPPEADRLSTTHAPWIAAIAVAVASYLIEYAQGVWPHLVTVALVAGGAGLCARALDERSWAWAAGGGFLVAVAAGVRYQNAFILGCLGLGLLVLARRRTIAAVSFAAGAALPLLVTALLNQSRVGSLNPISKGQGYLPSAAKVTAGGSGTPWIEKVATLAWARIVDYSEQPPIHSMRSFHWPDAESGAYVVMGAVKKAWLQSAPWMIVPLVLFALAWLPRPAFARIGGSASQRQLRLLSLVVLPTLVMFSFSGTYRNDGFCFNQRYFCELVPLMAIAFAWGVEGIASRRTALLTGVLGGAALGYAAVAQEPTAALRHRLLLYAPLLLGGILATAWLLAVEARARSRPSRLRAPALAAAAGAALAWALVVHLGDDLPASRRVRRSRHSLLARVAPHVPDGSALFAVSVEKDALGPILLSRDVVLVNPSLDQSKTAGELLDALLEQGRRVFLLPNALPEERLHQVLAGKQIRYVGDPPLLVEVRGGTT